MERAGEAPDDRVQDAVARNAAVKAAVKECWPQVDPAKIVLRLLSEPEFLAECARGLLDEDEQKAVLWEKPARGVGSARWSAADAVLVDEAYDLVQRTSSLGHVVLDEAQDLSPMQYRAVGRRCTTGSATILGDLAQGTTPWATASWQEALGHLGKAEARIEELTRGFRVPREVIAYASRLLPSIAPGLAPATSVRESAGALEIRRVAPQELDAAVLDACTRALGNEGSIGLIAAEARLEALAAALDAAGTPYLAPGQETSATARLTLVPASLAKGLEYDYVVLDEPGAIVDGEPDERTGLRRLYVCLTRAVSGLAVLHTTALPEPLRD
jgi:DNA helicase IV